MGFFRIHNEGYRPIILTPPLPFAKFIDLRLNSSSYLISIGLISITSQLPMATYRLYMYMYLLRQKMAIFSKNIVTFDRIKSELTCYQYAPVGLSN